MNEQLRTRLSNSSDDSPWQEEVSDNEHETTPPDEDYEVAEPLDPRNSQLSLVSAAAHSLDDRRHHRRSVTHRDFFRQIADEGAEAKKLRRMFRAAIERLDSETRRAQEAERRALELAQRFKIVNEARVSAQQEVDRAHAELRLYKVQLDNAQREILRGSDLLKDLESQRDSAEASAARARSTARRLKEEQLMMKAREEGRREGYQEGLRRGYQQARGPGLDGQFDVPPAGMSAVVGAIPTAGDYTRTDPLDGFSMMNLSTPPPLAGIPLASSFGSAPEPGIEGFGAGAQGSRFKEIIGSPSTLRSAPLGTGSQAAGDWPMNQDEETRIIRPTAIHNVPMSPRHGAFSVPPDGYIPSVGADNIISIPPPHELHQPPSMSSMQPSTVSAADEAPRLAPVPGVHSRDYAYMPRNRASPGSLAESVPSTTISQFDLVSYPNTLRERMSGLSAIPEVSSSMEFSPSTDGRVRSAIIPDALTFAVPDDRLTAGASGSETPARPRSRSRELNQRISDELRYSDPEQVEQWRQSSATQSHPSSSRERLHMPHRPAHITTPSPLGPTPNPVASSAPGSSSIHRRSRSVQSPPSDGRPYLGAGPGPGSHRRTASSTPITIEIEPPSGPSSHLSPASMRDGMLSPDGARQPLPPPRPMMSSPSVPDRPHSRGYNGHNHPYGYSPSAPTPVPYYNNAPQSPVSLSSPRHTPEPIRIPPPFSMARSSSASTAQGRTRSRAASADFSGRVGDLAGRPITPIDRPSSTDIGAQPSWLRPVTPGQSSVGHGEPPGRVPDVLRSPSRASSRQSLHPELARPSSRASADRQRTLSMHAGSTPAIVTRPLSGGSQIHRVPSASSINSDTSRKSGAFQHYNPQQYVDPAFLASSEDLTSMQSPNTMANTRINSAWTGPGGSRLRPSSPSMSYASFRS